MVFDGGVCESCSDAHAVRTGLEVKCGGRSARCEVQCPAEDGTQVHREAAGDGNQWFGSFQRMAAAAPEMSIRGALETGDATAAKVSQYVGSKNRHG